MAPATANLSRPHTVCICAAQILPVNLRHKLANYRHKCQLQCYQNSPALHSQMDTVAAQLCVLPIDVHPAAEHNKTTQNSPAIHSDNSPTQQAQHTTCVVFTLNLQEITNYE